MIRAWPGSWFRSRRESADGEGELAEKPGGDPAERQASAPAPGEAQAEPPQTPETDGDRAEPAMAMEMTEVGLLRLAVVQIAAAFTLVELTPADKKVLNAINAEPDLLDDRDKRSARGIELTDGAWAVLAAAALQNWASDNWRFLYGLHARWSSAPGGSATGGLLERAMEAAGAVGLAGLAGGPYDELSERMLDLGRALAATADEDRAYDCVAIAIDLAQEPLLRIEAASAGLELGIRAGRTHQSAFCSVAIARAKADVADTDQALTLEAFDAYERALEYVAAASQPFRSAAAEALLQGVDDRPYLRILAPAIVYHMDDHPARPQLLQIVPSWPPRITHDDINQMAQRLVDISKVTSWLNELDSRRLALEVTPASAHARVDWIRWTLDHPAYRHAVPHSRSFLREKKADSQICSLAHEYTHVLTLIGILGRQALALRAAALDTEIDLWSRVADADERMEREGIAPLEPGSTTQLLQAERSVELASKSSALLDVWTPWLEGLAIFAETGADPALDDVRIGQVANLLRSLIDFEPSADAPEEKLEEEWKTFVQEFEERVSSAIRRTAPDHAYDFFVSDPDRTLYLCGYLAVRSVVASWRSRLEGALAGPQALDLLIHATRFGTRDAVPDLDLGAEEFAKQCFDRMARWVRDLARLPAEDINDFVGGSGLSGGGQMYAWRGGRPVPAEQGDDSSIWPLEDSIDQAIMTLLHPGDSKRLAQARDDLAALMEGIAEIVRDHRSSKSETDAMEMWARAFGGMYEAQSMLPVGRTDAIFFLNIEEEEERGRLYVQLRTTEHHVDTGGPSVNGLSFPIPLEQALALAEEYRRLGSPRIRVTRLADVAGQIPGLPPGANLFSFDYGNWHWVQGTNSAVGSLIRTDGRLANVERIVRNRLFPPPFIEAEMRWIADGLAGARRTLEWLRADGGWELEEEGFDSAPWRALVQSKAEALLDPSARRARRNAVCRDLLAGLFGDGKLVSFVIDDGISKKLSAEDQERLCEALACTAGLPGPSDWLDRSSHKLAQAGANIFHQAGGSWDARPVN